MGDIVSKLMHLRENKQFDEIKLRVYLLDNEDKAELLSWLYLVFLGELAHITYSELTAAIKKEFYL